MTVVEISRTEEAPAAARSSGDDFTWYPATDEPRYNPVTDIRLRPPGAKLVTTEWLSAVVENASAALSMLQRLDTSELDAETTTAWAEGVERLRRQADAAAISVADHVDRTQPFKSDGFFTAKAWLKHHLQLSGTEAFTRVQEAKFARRVPIWATAEGGGQVGVAQLRVMARIAANPRIPSDVLDTGARLLMADAMQVSFDEFERLARTWESLADPLGAADQAERNRERRDASIHYRPDGSFDLHAKFDGVGGAEFLETFSHYVDAEFAADWKEAVDRLGEGNVDVTKLRRTEPHRRADALLAMARAAAACPPNTNRPLPTVNFLIDEATAAAAATGAPIDPDRYGDVVSRTDRGHLIHRGDIVGAAVWALIRRVVIDSSGVVIDLSRRSRLFTGAAREAVMLLEPTCIWPGCDQPHTWCHADHLVSWSARGPTTPSNGGPLCGRHNRLKELGFDVVRDADGRWHIIDPDGREIT